jgi:hypothetical protein
MSRISVRRVGLPATALSLVLLLSVPAGVLADTELGHRGRVGRHMLRDTAERPGVTCFYDDSGELRGVGVRPPRVLARNVTDEVDQQRVSWQFVVQRRANPDADWKVFARSSMQSARAWDNEPARFAAMAIRLLRPASDDPLLTEYRVIVRMLWWRGGDVVGVARHMEDWYRWKGVDTKVVGPDGACGAEWVIV